MPDGLTVNVKVPKQAEAGLINNQQEAFSFKVGSQHACMKSDAVLAILVACIGGSTRL